MQIRNGSWEEAKRREDKAETHGRPADVVGPICLHPFAVSLWASKPLGL